MLVAAKHAKVPQIPLFPALSKGDERGISGFLCALGVPEALLRTGLAREDFLKWVGQTFHREKPKSLLRKSASSRVDVVR
jgi:hypothetical protein